jgi:hypothetical protein
MVGVYGREIGRVRFHYAAKEWLMLGRPVLPKIPFIRSVEEAGIKKLRTEPWAGVEGGKTSFSFQKEVMGKRKQMSQVVPAVHRSPVPQGSLQE